MPDNQRIDDLRRRVQKDPASIAFAQLAEELRRAGQLDESIDTCRTGLTRHPGYLSARVTLGRALLELNELEAAQGELEHVLRSAPENLAAIRGLGEIHHRRGDLAAALAQYRAALALARNDPDLEETVAELARQVEPPAPVIEPPPLASAYDLQPIESALEPFASEEVAPSPPAWDVSDASDIFGAPFAASGVAGTLIEPEVAPAMHEPVPSGAEIEHAARTVAALEQWLDAIHVARADRRAPAPA